MLKILPLLVGLLSLYGCIPRCYSLTGKDVQAIPSTIPTQKHLRELCISGTSITTFPPELAALKQLTRLDLSNNQLCQVPTFIGQLIQLKELSLAENGLHQLVLTAPIWDIQYIEKLAQGEAYAYQEFLKTSSSKQHHNLSIDQVTALSNDIQYVQILKDRSSLNSQAIHFPRTPEHVQYIKAIFNKYSTTFPNEINQLPQLERLELQGNLYTDAFVEGLDPTALKQLTTLNLSNNALVTFPMHLGKLEKLTTLDLSHNAIESFPEYIQGFEQLKYLNLSHTHIYEIPNSLEKFEQLEVLILSNLGGYNLPETLGNLQHLTSLDISGASFKVLPSTIGNLSQLKYLHLENSGITVLPTTCKALKNLKQIVLSEDQQQIKEQVEQLLPHCAVHFSPKE